MKIKPYRPSKNAVHPSTPDGQVHPSTGAPADKVPPERIVRRDEGGPWIVGNGGSVAGYTAYLCFDPETGKIAPRLPGYPIIRRSAVFPRRLR